MKHDWKPRHDTILAHLNTLPRKMLSVYGIHNVTELVLADLCSKNCFAIDKAAYFVDNPDFNCLKGVAGFAASEAYHDMDSMWHNHAAFSDYIQQCDFNKKVRDQERHSLKLTPEQEHKIALEIARDLGFNKPTFCSWHLKNDNHGLLIFERPDHMKEDEELLLNGLSILGFCPVY